MMKLCNDEDSNVQYKAAQSHYAAVQYDSELQH